MNAPANQIPLQSATVGSDDEIDLFELIAVVWNGRRVLLGLMVTAVTLAAIYVGLTPKLYNASADIYPVNTIQLALISPGFSADAENRATGELSPELLFNTALMKLHSENMAEQFLSTTGAQVNPQGANPQTAKQFLDALSVSKEKSGTRAAINLHGTQPQETATQLKAYLNFVSQAVIVSVSRDLLAALDASIQYIDRSMEQARQQAENKRLDKAAVLAEAADIAAALSIQEPRIDHLAHTEVTPFNDKLYLLGTRALQAELAALQSRKQKDAFIPELRQLEAAKSALLMDAEKVRQHQTSIDAFTLPASILAPTQPAAPKTALILIAAVVIGLIAGLVTVFVRQGIRAYKIRTQSAYMAGYKKEILRREGHYAVL
ncbi:hypothetical protein FKG94_02475 [Exilibacterium tricleocarpae]|uniref:Polysaccharide chain length determinant N-terminal domain-containing protein n=1 Tax=Exilibacterium tricleocarpae TaxID=2591008 RepID=A0A545U8D9_9GAMM|nr:Wzz/FepE/Etk N-terminal domain-containing protein [Exilibacterium tricleocarpae]TQV85728.1 hypothetical protein FKG94_02475 [Exilibacterium tricleocarpae]